MNDGKYDLLNFVYYEQLKQLFQGTASEKLALFYQQHDEHIAQYMIQVIQKNQGKKIIFLVGADHRDFALKKISSELGTNVLLHSF